MIDLHTHILFDIDDGAQSLEVSVEMARLALADGVSCMAATPHGRAALQPGSRYSVARLRRRLEALRAALQAAGLPLEIVAGTEIYGEGDMVGRLRSGDLLPYAGSHAVLVEFPSGIVPTSLEQIIFGLQLAGYRVVVAHPERIHFVQDDPNRLIPLIERGALLQLTGDALIGAQGRRLQRLAETLLNHRLIQLIASDCHGPHFDRMPNMGQARRAAAALVGEATADRLTRATPAAILADAPIQLDPPERIRRLFGW